MTRNDVRGRGLTAHSGKNRYEWVIIHETWPVQKVQSKNALSSSDCTAMILTTLRSSSHECLHGRYTGWSPPPTSLRVTSCPPDVTHVMNETRPSPFFALFRFRVLYVNANRRAKTGEAWERGYLPSSFTRSSRMMRLQMSKKLLLSK